MQLNLEDGRTLPIRSWPEVASALAAVGVDGNGFVILSRHDGSYIQASGTRAKGFRIEYRDDRGQRHYGSRRSDIAHADMIRLFGSYYRQEHDWQAGIEWQEVELEPIKRRPQPLVGRRNAIILLVAGALLCLGSWAQFGQTDDFDRHLGEATGTVVALERQAQKGSMIPKVYLTVRFVAADQEYTVADTLDHDVFATGIGDRIHVLYDTRAPGTRYHLRDDRREVWREYHALAITGGLLIVAGGALLVMAARRPSPRKTLA